jgi:hypothetical protein
MLAGPQLMSMKVTPNWSKAAARGGDHSQTVPLKFEGAAYCMPKLQHQIRSAIEAQHLGRLSIHYPTISQSNKEKNQ